MFQGYSIFDANYNFEIYKFCSLNCGLKYIIDSKNELVKKLKNFFNFYEISPKNISQALPYTRLKIFGGDLNYKEYRENFVIPERFTLEDTTENSYIYDYVVTKFSYDLNYYVDESNSI
jgi:hypothetical protein